MKIKIITPEALVFDGEVDSVLVPGVSGDFQIMKDHAAIVSSLKTGKVRIFTPKVPDVYADKFQHEPADEEFSYPIASGVIEFNHNNGIILCEDIE